jgi:hypothetical protein
MEVTTQDHNQILCLLQSDFASVLVGYRLAQMAS